MTAPVVLIAGGGTGGHVFPAVAVAEAIQRLADVSVVFCGTARGLESRIVPARGWRFELMDIAPIKGVGLARGIRGAFMAVRATVRALSLVRRLRPRLVLSVGGYAGGPVAFASAAAGVPIGLLEPNRVVGLSNRLLAPFARRAYLAWPEVGARFDAKARRVYGVPLRDGFSPIPYAPRSKPRLLVLGGSQGAQALNERIPEAVARVHVPSLEVLHQAGRGRAKDVAARYAGLGVSGVQIVEFVDDVARAIADADLVVARAGAVTIAEVTAIGRAALLVPYPYAADDHQRKNAEELARGGAAVCVPQAGADAETLARHLEKLLLDSGTREAMARASRELGKPQAAVQIASDLLALAAIPRKGAAL